jgi:hypothetical protein
MNGAYGVSTVTNDLAATAQSFLSRFILGCKAGPKLCSDSPQIFYWF